MSVESKRHGAEVAVIGIGKLGVAFSAAVASAGHDVIGVDVNEDQVQLVNDGIAPFPEPGLQEHFDEHGGRIEATTDVSDAVRTADVSFVFVPTPSQDDGSFDDTFVRDAASNIAKALQQTDDYHLVVVSSTVSPGTMVDVKHLIEEKSGKNCGDEWGLCYNPAFISQGTIIRDFLNPEILLVGESDPVAGDVLVQLWNSMLDSDPVISRMNFMNSEISKITFNVYSTMKISFANQMAILCGQMEGANVDTVMNAIKHDDRVGGKKLFTGGLGFGGPCLPRDNSAFQQFADLPSSLDIQERVDNINEAIPELVKETVSKEAENGGTIGILGLTYKPETHITTESQALEIARDLESKGYDILSYDPKAEERNCDNVEAVLDSADMVLTLTPWSEFADLPAESFDGMSVFDAWRLHYDELAGRDGYFAFGVNAPSSSHQNLEDALEAY